MMLAKWDSQEQVVWQRTYLYSFLNFAFDLEVLSDGSIVTTGAILDKAVWMKTNTDGDPVHSTDNGRWLAGAKVVVE
jgi:hypothetical protein